MLSKFKISNFRGMENCEINNLGQINLFIGKNNSGKSSILEALCFAKVPFKPVDSLGRPVLQQLLNRRVRRTYPSLEEFIYNYEPENKISFDLTFGAQETISIGAACNETWIRYSIRSPPDSKIKSVASIVCQVSGQDVNIEGAGGGTTREPLVFLKRITEGSVPPDMEQNRKYLAAIMQNLRFLGDTELIDDDFVNNMDQVERAFWSRMLSSRKDKDVALFLNDIYESKIESFTFKPYHLERERGGEGDRYKLFMALANIALHIDDYGDGFRYAFSILTSALLFKDRALLIEEIESHQHPSSLRKLLNVLLKIVKDNNLQLFITTHNPWVFRFLELACEDRSLKKEFRCFHVERNSETGEVKANVELDYAKISRDIFEGESLKRAMEN